MIEFNKTTTTTKIGYLFDKEIVGPKEIIIYRTRKPIFSLWGFTVLGKDWTCWKEVGDGVEKS